MHLDHYLHNTNIYAPTLVKYLARKKDILYFLKGIDVNKKINLNPMNPEQCKFCQRIEENRYCKSHTELDRVKKYIQNNNYYYLKGTPFGISGNEIFTFKNGKLFIAYCPHTVLCKEYDSDQLFKIIPMTFEEDLDLENQWKKCKVKILDPTMFQETKLKFWFNKKFSMIFESFRMGGYKYNFEINNIK